MHKSYLIIKILNICLNLQNERYEIKQVEKWENYLQKYQYKNTKLARS